MFYVLKWLKLIILTHNQCFALLTGARWGDSDICLQRLQDASLWWLFWATGRKTKVGKIKSMLQGLNIPSGMGTPWDPPANTESSAGEIFDLKRWEKTEREGERESPQKQQRRAHKRKISEVNQQKEPQIKCLYKGLFHPTKEAHSTSYSVVHNSNWTLRSTCSAGVYI